MASRVALTLRCTAVLVYAGASSAAFAQDADILNDFRLDDLEFRRGQFVTVRERPQPLYDPVPARLGPVEVLPRLRTQAIYDSNVFAVGNASGDVALRGIADVEANWSSGGLAVEADAEVDRRQYLDFGGQSTTDYALGTAIRYTPRRGTGFFAGARLGRETEALVDPAAPLNSVQPSQYDIRYGFVGAARQFNRLRVAGRVSAEDRSYSEGVDALGNPIDQSFRNRTLYTAELAAEYELGPERSVFAIASVNRRDYRNRPPLQPERDSRGYRIEAGASFMLTPLIRSRISAGYFAQDFESPFFSTISGLAIRGRLDYAVTQLLTLSLTASRGVEEASTIGTGAFVASRVGLQADYELLRNLILSAGLSYERDRFEDIDRRYRIRRATLGAGYRLSPRLRFDAEYEARDHDSFGASPGRDFVRHQVTLGITLQGI
ncbi:outer membrane beta-barrel protein [Sphingosinicella sp. LHD-64]|uniref:outer membrane beta-barrel protein n=1 Tax=Sphingosinicella sp. LHD-64 TaxID=3072139 RepID=UPI00280CF254|nr:outer membrane beta-barrel protein [Sphingosinicella sp. LHD-64]MDQ8755448.1 outer membrane beta-barrel protein [Sphingosinicella sp. LHD-64]